MADLWDRLRGRVRKTGTCWIWQGSNDGRYGFTYVETINGKEKKTSAHRAVYQALVGEIPEGLVIDHLCGNKMCVNPEHLEPVTQQENLMRSESNVARINSLKTHCINGHEFTPENTYRRKDRPRATRECRECRTNATRRFAWRT